VKFQRNYKTIWRLILTGLSPRSVAGSIILPIVLVTIIAVAIATTVSTNRMSNTATRGVEMRLDNAAVVASEQLGSVLARSLSDAAALSQNPILISNEATPTEKLAEMKRVQTFYGTFEDITLVGLDGNVITSTNYQYYGQLANNTLFQSAAHGNPSMTDVATVTDPSTVVLRVSSPVVDANSTITSVLLAQINIDYVWQMIGSTKVEDTGSIYLVNEFGNIIAGPDKSQILQKMGFVGENNGMPPQHQLIQYKDGGRKMCAVIAPVNPQVPWAGDKWSFVAVWPAAQAFATVHEAQVFFWISMLSLLGLFAVVGLVVGHNISTKIGTLAKGTAEIASGNLSYRLPAMQPKELGQLADSFNSMAARLESSSAEIAKWNAHLAEEIEAKTKELEKLMAGKVQSERLSAMGYIAASVAHELNDPLTAISGYAQLGVKESEKSHPPEEMPNTLKNASDYFRNIEKELQRSKNIIRKLISFVRYSKTSNGAVDVNQVMGDTLGIARHHLEINNVELFTQLQPDLPMVRGDARQLQQVFLNMVLNAQQAMPQGGKLNVETRQRNGNQPRVEVLFSDNGILTVSLDKIFEPLPSTEAEGQGTRIDLSVTHDIVKQFGGEIRVNTEAGVGTTYIISLPISNGSSLENKVKQP